MEHSNKANTHASPFPGDLAPSILFEATGTLALPGQSAIAIRIRVTDVSTQDAPATAPVMLAAPELDGTGIVGRTILAKSGQWAGEPIPALTFLWLRNGTAMQRADEPSYTPTFDDEGSLLSCRIRATNSHGTIELETEEIRIVHVAPIAPEGQIDLVFDRSEGSEQIDLSLFFIGEDLHYEGTDTESMLDPLTGLMSIETGEPFSARRLEIAASNSGERPRSFCLLQSKMQSWTRRQIRMTMSRG